MHISRLIIILLMLIIIGIIVSVIISSTTMSSTSHLVFDAKETITINNYDFVELINNHSRDRENIASSDPKDIDFSRDSKIGYYNLSVHKQTSGYSGIIRGSTWNGCCSVNAAPTFSYVYSIKLDINGSIKSLERVELDYNNFNKCSHVGGIEDPRLFCFNNEDWVMANCLGSEQQPDVCVNAMCIFKLLDPHQTFRILATPLNVQPEQRQKNWSPFEHNGDLYCEYSINPHIILKIDTNTGLTEEKYRTGSINDDIVADDSLRGGAPPILITNFETDTIDPEVKPQNPKNFYLGVGHTRISATSDYLHFFYIFEASPPFKIIKLSSEFKIDGMERIQFVSGLSLEGNMVHISYGVDDCYNRISTFDIKDIIHLLDQKTVSSL